MSIELLANKSCHLDGLDGTEDVMETKTVILRASWLPTWERLSDAEVGAMCRAFLRHAAGEDVDPATLPGRYAPGMYAVHLLQLDADRAAYTATCDRRAAAGRKGGRPRKDAENEPEETPEPEPKPRKGMSEAEQKELFGTFWKAAGDSSQSPAGAWSWWKKAVHSVARAEELTTAAERAQALQDARGLARYNVIGWLRKQGWKAQTCTDEGIFRAELARASSGRRAAPAVGSTENALTALLGGAEPEPVDVQAIEEGRHD